MNRTVDLRTLPLLADATPAQAASLLQAARIRTVEPGDDLFEPFAITDAYWVLIAGRWRVTRRVAGREQVMFEAERPGTWTGGIAVIDAIAPPKADILARSQVLGIPSTALEALAAENAQVAKRLLEAVHWGAGHIGHLIPDTQEIDR